MDHHAARTARVRKSASRFQRVFRNADQLSAVRTRASDHMPEEAGRQGTVLRVRKRMTSCTVRTSFARHAQRGQR
jgi:hypothetical protein